MQFPVPILHLKPLQWLSREQESLQELSSQYVYPEAQLVSSIPLVQLVKQFPDPKLHL